MPEATLSYEVIQQQVCYGAWKELIFPIPTILHAKVPVAAALLSSAVTCWIIQIFLQVLLPQNMVMHYRVYLICVSAKATIKKISIVSEPGSSVLIFQRKVQ